MTTDRMGTGWLGSKAWPSQPRRTPGSGPAVPVAGMAGGFVLLSLGGFSDGPVCTARRKGALQGAPLPSGTMPTLRQLSIELGISRDALKRRVGIARSLGVDGCARDGAHGTLVISEEMATLIRRALELERTGFPMQNALRRALDEAHGAHNPARSSPETQPQTCGTDGRTAVRASDPYLPVLWVLAAALALGVLGVLAACFLALFLR